MIAFEEHILRKTVTLLLNQAKEQANKKLRYDYTKSKINNLV